MGLYFQLIFSTGSMNLTVLIEDHLAQEQSGRHECDRERLAKSKEEANKIPAPSTSATEPCRGLQLSLGFKQGILADRQII